MEWLADLESTCSALGTTDGVHYHKDSDCIECVKDLIRFLRRDDGSHVVRRSLGMIARFFRFIPRKLTTFLFQGKLGLFQLT